MYKKLAVDDSRPILSRRAVLAVGQTLLLAALAGCGGGGATSQIMQDPGSPPDPNPAPSVTFSSNPTSVASGASATLNWSSTHATSCSGSGSWSGTKAISGAASTGALAAASTFSLLCSGAGGSTTRSVTVGVNGGSPITGLNFPSNYSTSADVRFRLTGANLLAPYPATYLWRVNVRHQPGYYTTFFWGPDGAFTGSSFYGAHPYPDGGGGNTTTHKWEISINANDYVNDANGNSTQLGYDVWRTQALTVDRVNTSEIEAKFYWDLPDTSKVIVHTTLSANYANTFPAAPYAGHALTFGDAPWSLGNERLGGILRGIQLYSSVLPINDILAEANAPLTTSAGNNSIWYLNINPTPSDISDKSGRGHHPSWVGSGRPALWMGP